MKGFMCVTVFLVILCQSLTEAAATGPVTATSIKGGQTRQFVGAFGAVRNYCPLCDSSVYSYCHEKIIHDSCCCQGRIPGQGSFACLDKRDCDFLYANTCEEHALIAECCCDD